MARTKLTLDVIDLHCAGEPLRLITGGYPEVPLAPILERRRWVAEHLDHLRRVAIYEPRGHRDMYAAVLFPPYLAGADLAMLFMHNEGYSTMCGHGTIAVATALVEEGLFPMSGGEREIRFEIPAGLVTARVSTHRTPSGDVEATSARFTNVPSYLAASDLRVRVDGITVHGGAAERGHISVDIGFGGAYYGIVEAADLGLRIEPGQIAALTRAGVAITDVLRREHTPRHPHEPDLGFVYGTIIVERDPPALSASAGHRAKRPTWRNVTIFADAEVDRSPCGSGTSALLAQAFARGQLKVGDKVTNAGITGAVFGGQITGETKLGRHSAIETSIAGNAYVTGFTTLVVDERDPLGDGFLLR